MTTKWKKVLIGFSIALGVLIVLAIVGGIIAYRYFIAPFVSTTLAMPEGLNRTGVVVGEGLLSKSVYIQGIGGIGVRLAKVALVLIILSYAPPSACTRFGPALSCHARGNNGQEIFSEAKDYKVFLEQLREARRRYPFYLYAYVLMPNHFHLLLEVMEWPTARIMQSLLTGYVRRFNRKHRRKGHLFQGRYKAIVCDRDSYLLQLVRYIHLNPLRARLVRRPADWQWSGHGEYLGTSKNGLIDAGAVMEEFKTPIRYEAFVRAGVKEPYREEWHPGDHAPFLGKEEFVRKVAAQKKRNSATRPAKLEVLLKARAKEAGLEPQAVTMRGKSRLIGEVRRGFIEAAVLEQGYQASEVASFLGCHASNVSRALQKRGSKI